jgi:hypothetical protein
MKLLNSSPPIFCSVKAIDVMGNYDLAGIKRCSVCSELFFLYVVKKYHSNKILSITCPHCDWATLTSLKP